MSESEGGVRSRLRFGLRFGVRFGHESLYQLGLRFPLGLSTGKVCCLPWGQVVNGPKMWGLQR